MSAGTHFLRPRSHLSRRWGGWALSTTVGALMALSGAAWSAAAAAPPSPQVQTTAGPVQGRWFEEGRVAAYLGLPFAKAPVGALRFEKPQPGADWQDQPLDASRFKPACMQQGRVPTDIGMSEDCLYLNVYVPQKPTADGQPRPVMVFLHGGRYWTGRSSENKVEKLAEQTGAIVVTTAYRLNAFGFLANDSLARTGNTNLGLQDQQMALRWLQKNVASFGGNPQLITLFGESAGAGSVLLQLLDPASQGLFQRAVLQSTWQWRLPTLAQASTAAQTLAQRLNCPTAPSADMLACLKQQPAAKLLPSLADSNAFQPVVDGQRLRAQPLTLLTRGAYAAKVPVFIGLNAEEGNFMAMSRTGWKKPDQPVDDATYLKATRDALQPFYPAEQVEDILSWYAPVRARDGNWRALSQLMGDFYLNCGSYEAAKVLARRSGNYAYWYAHLSSNHTKPYLGATHGDELDLLFAAPVYPPGYPLTASDRTLSQQMMSSWGHFARTGQPGPVHGQPWPALTSATPLAPVLAEPALRTLHPFNDTSGLCARWRDLLL